MVFRYLVRQEKFYNSLALKKTASWFCSSTIGARGELNAPFLESNLLVDVVIVVVVVAVVVVLLSFVCVRVVL